MLFPSLSLAIPILLEKPISKSLSDAMEVKKLIKKNSDRIILGYTWRWWKPFKTVSKNLNKKLLGEIKHVQFHMSAHLADWHPWEPYQEFFMSSKELGGGALLDESHRVTVNSKQYDKQMDTGTLYCCNHCEMKIKASEQQEYSIVKRNEF